MNTIKWTLSSSTWCAATPVAQKGRFSYSSPELPVPEETVTWKPFPNPATGYSTWSQRQNYWSACLPTAYLNNQYHSKVHATFEPKSVKPSTKLLVTELKRQSAVRQFTPDTVSSIYCTSPRTTVQFSLLISYHYRHIFAASNRNEYQEYFLEDKGSRCVGLTTLSLSCADCLEIWKPQTPGTLRACPDL